jgi:GT2 family glycosyltransferase
MDTCLASLRALRYPGDRFDIVIVESKRGLCAALNAAVRDAGGDFVALLAGDARVDPEWLTELVSAAGSCGATGVASTILDWSGGTVEFAGKPVSFSGHVGELADVAAVAPGGDGRLLFASSAAALYDRAAFLEAGGLDEDFVAVLEDVDLGWRLNLLGRDIVLASGARTYRRAPLASSRTAAARRARLEERNALAMVYKNFDADTRARIFPAAVALSLWRGLKPSSIGSLDLRMSTRPPETVDVDPILVAHLMALEDFCGSMESLEAQRQRIQDRRRRTDRELGRWFQVRGDDEIARALVSEFRIEELFASPGAGSGRPAIDGANQALDFESANVPVAVSTVEPNVSIVILTALGATHLHECLASLRAQTYPHKRREVIVVDNGSASDPTADVEREYPGARVIRSSTNIGFAAGNNLGAASATGDFLVFLNDDTRADPGWLRQLVDTARRRRSAAVASRILDWSGSRIDFVKGAVNFQGKGFQLHYDAPAEALALDEQPLLFACGAAMMVERTAFVDAGRWDEEAFAYYEDVELGWRLNLLGGSIWLAPTAIVYHKHHGTSSRWAEAPRTRLYERNALRMLFTLLSSRSLERALPAALLLAADRALLGTRASRAHDVSSGLVRRTVRSLKELLRARGIGKTTTPRQAIGRLGIGGLVGCVKEAVRSVPTAASRRLRAAFRLERGEAADALDAPFAMPIQAAARLAGIHSFLAALPQLSRRRANLQRRRTIADTDLLEPFGSHWLSSSGAAPFQAEHDAFHAALVRVFRLEELVASRGDDFSARRGEAARARNAGNGG